MKLYFFYCFAFIFIFLNFSCKQKNGLRSLNNLKIVAISPHVSNNRNGILREEEIEEDEEGSIHNETDDIMKAMQWWNNRMIDPFTQTVPVDRLTLGEKIEIERMSILQNQLSNGRMGASNDDILNLQWTERGPNEIGGRTRAIFIDKRDPKSNVVFAAGVTGGIWKTNNFQSTNTTWQLVADQLYNIGVTALAQDPSNPNIIYAGTGEAWFNIDAAQGNGIYKSTDGGVTWNQIPSTAIVRNTNLTFRYTQDILVDENGIVYAATMATGPDGLACGQGGIMRSTDGGNSWTNVLISNQNPNVPSPCTNTYNYDGIQLVEAVNGDIYAITGGIIGGIINSPTYINDKSRMYVSRRATNGNNTGSLGTWTEITPNQNVASYGREKMAIAKDSRTIYVLAAGFGNTSLATKMAAIFKSTDAGNTWSQLPLPNWCDQDPKNLSNDFTRNQAWYDQAIDIDPNNPNNCVIGGIDLFRTVNGGNSWSQITSWSGNCSSSLSTIHADHHTVKFFPNSSTSILNTNDGGIAYSCDGGKTWVAKNNNYNVTQFYGLAMRPEAGSNYFICGAQDNNTTQYTQAGINPGIPIIGGDGCLSYISPTKPDKIQIGTTPSNSFYFSIDGGQNFNYPIAFSLGGQSTGSFVTPYDYDALTDTMFTYGVTAGLSPTVNGVLMFRFNNPLDIVGISNGSIQLSADEIWLSSIPSNSINNNTAITDIQISPNVLPTRILYCGTNNGLLIRVDRVTTPNPNSNNIQILPNKIIFQDPQSRKVSISSVAIDTTGGNDDHLMVSISNYGVSKLYETKNATASSPTWVDVTGNLPDMPVWYAIFNPNDPTQAIIGTELGVWTTTQLNGNNTIWTPTSTPFPRTRVVKLTYRPSDGTLAASTHGRGFWTTQIGTSAPPTFILFNGENEKSNNQINWALSQELTTSSYTLERALDIPQNFAPITQIPVAERSPYSRNYTYSDPTTNISHSHFYYRVKAISINGTPLYSNIIELNKENGFVNFVSNISPGQLNIKMYYEDPSAYMTAYIYDIRGALISQQKMPEQSSVLNISNLSTGIYILIIKGQQGEIYKKEFTR